MSARTIDIAIQLLGSNAFAIKEEAGGYDLTAYEAAKRARGGGRTLIQITAGADDDLAPNVAAMIAHLEKVTGNDFGRVGVLTIIGTSNSSFLAVALGVALTARAVPIRLVGVADLPLLPYGRKPPVPGVGRLIPIDGPSMGLGATANPVGRVIDLASRKVTARPLSSTPPRVAVAGLTAERRVNIYQTAGNGVKFTKNRPDGSVGWWWWSDMKQGNLALGEVHGTIDDWDNRKLSVGTWNSDDDALHVALCGVGLTRLREEVSAELAKFPA